MNSRPHSGPSHRRSPSRATLAGRYREAVATLRNAEIPTPELDARLLICQACGVNRETFFAKPERELDEAEQNAFRQSMDRRLAREPVSRIIGSREFWGLDFSISPHTLDPRPDTETLVRAALEVVSELEDHSRISVLDLGTGSGCVLVSLLHELERANGTGIDICERALSVARSNAIRHGVDARAEFVCGSWSSGCARNFDLIVANPPYIRTSDIPALEPEVRDFDPSRALNGGSDGLDAYRAIISRLGSCLAPGGWIILEVGAGQAARVGEMVSSRERAPALGEFRQWSDLAGVVRCVGARRSATL